MGNSVACVSDVIDPSLKDYDHSKLRNLVSKVESGAIFSIYVSVEDNDDQLVWHFNPKGAYTVKSGYQCAQNQSDAPLQALPSPSFKWSDQD
ncbi:hypothetical protein LOK49_LG03G02095 [Camellia lanceoleosa]|uniref:Uncharacterized protein n=1 Tax=Camellia lanceoleosa TaxID=1840588 RepID=A0ACC0IGI8_9ERIC|nr:hypothetical protein LOK49_LG03G02095 [Camellia lanceoleosa]